MVNPGDGSNIGIGAERALASILGGEPEPEAEERLTREELSRQLADVPTLNDIRVGKAKGLGYGETATVATRAILEFWSAHPEFKDCPVESEYEPDAWKDFDGDSQNFPKPVRAGLYDVMKQHDYDLGVLDLTGFMWGFAYNQARWLRYEEPESNPAIIEI